MRLCEPVNGQRTRKRMRAGMSPFGCGLARRCCAHSHEQSTPVKHWRLFRSATHKAQWRRAGTESPPRPATSRQLNVNVRCAPQGAYGIEQCATLHVCCAGRLPSPAPCHRPALHFTATDREARPRWTPKPAQAACPAAHRTTCTWALQHVRGHAAVRSFVMISA